MRVTNAGLVLTAPYLPPLFARLHLLAADGRFRSSEAAGRGVHFLQYLVDGSLVAGGTKRAVVVLVAQRFQRGVGIQHPAAARAQHRGTEPAPATPP